MTDLSQAEKALQYAQRIRLARAETKRKVASGQLDVAELIVNVPDFMQGAEIGAVLMWQRRWGKSLMRRFLLDFGISENQTLGFSKRRSSAGISDRKRCAMAERLQEMMIIRETRRLQDAANTRSHGHADAA